MKYIERKTENGKNIVILKYAAFYYYWMWLTLLLSLLWWRQIVKINLFIVFASWAILFLSAAPYWHTISELKKKMKEKGISARGSKYSFKNPLTYEWDD